MIRKNIYWGVFLIALATLAWEILLVRIFSATMYYHFVFISICLAMMGFGCSGVIVFLFPQHFSQNKCNNHLIVSSSLFAATLIVFILVYLQLKVAFQPSLSTFFVLLLIFFTIFLPYFFSGLTITLALKHYSKTITTLYSYDLMGAGVGCLFVTGMLFVYDGITLVLLAAFLAACASVIFANTIPAKGIKKFSFALACITLLLFIINGHAYRFLRINYVQGIPQKNIIFEKWNPINRVTVTPTTIFGNDMRVIQYDSIATASMHASKDLQKVTYLNRFIQSFLYQLKKNAEVLIIGVGGGQDVLTAYINGQSNITGIEINPTIAQLNQETYRDFNGDLFHQPGIKLLVDEGRNFVRHSNAKYDIIHLPNVDSGVASSSGAFTFVENTLYTVEAFKDYYQHLTNEGILWITRWRSHQKYFLENFRVLTGLLCALDELGIKNPEKHIVIIEEEPKLNWRQAAIFVKKTPFRPEEVRDIDRLREQMNLMWLYQPSERIDNTLNDYIYTNDKKAFLEQYPFRVDPNTDDSPFFFNFLKPKHYIGKLPAIKTHFTYPVFMLKSLFVIVMLLVSLTILMPLLIFKKHTSSNIQIPFRGGYLFYFSCIGLGFMLTEIPFIQKFILFLGQPLYAIAVILSGLLVFSGIGSVLSGKLSEKTLPLTLCKIILTLCALLILYNYGLAVVFDIFLGKAALVRIIIAVLLILPLGILMGMAFPLAIRILDQDGSSMIPWVWGVNGIFSVMGSIIAWGLSLNFGYTTTIWASTLVYGCAAIVMLSKSRNLKRS